MIINRNGSILYDEQELYIENGYKRIVYTTPPENLEEYNLVSRWVEKENSIIQKWEHVRIEDDYSGQLLVAVRKFDESIQQLKIEMKENYNSNEGQLRKFIDESALIKLIYQRKNSNISTSKLLEQLSMFDLNLGSFFEWLQMKEFFDEMNFIMVEGSLFHVSDDLKEEDLKKLLKTDTKDFSEKQRMLLESNMITPQYVKSRLSHIYNLEQNSTQSNIIMYNMAFIYLFTLFDELLLKMIRIICMHDKNWLISKGNLTAEEIIKCDTTDDLHMLLVEKKVNELAWGSYLDKLCFLQDRGIRINKDNEKLFNEKILYLSTKRNILVHNEGIWNSSARDILNDTDFYQIIKIGESVVRTYESFEEACSYCKSAISYLYDNICNKFQFLYKFEFKDTDNLFK